MNLFKGLEKFGLKTEGTENLFEEEKRTNASTEQGEAKEEIPSEESFLLEKSVRCTVCDKVFKTKTVSYTHLDVYKRQDCADGCVSGQRT